jgi:tetratricopeptide (TPR) repeat protein
LGDRDSRAEALLVDGLDRYFAGHYEEAIHLWTRVLFLDRSHARARAYIDRARTALAERQRCADELLQDARTLLDRGDTGEARRVLGQAVATAGDDARAAELRLQLERVERARGTTSRPAPRTAAIVDAVPVPSRYRRVAKGLVVAGVAGCAVVACVALAGPMLRERALPGRPRALAPSGQSSSPTVLSTDEVALIRARTLYARGQLPEALRALDRITHGSARAGADALRVEIQQGLLAGRAGRQTAAPDPHEDTRR